MNKILLKNIFSKFQSKHVFHYYVLRNNFSEWQKEHIFSNFKTDTQNTKWILKLKTEIEKAPKCLKCSATRIFTYIFGSFWSEKAHKTQPKKNKKAIKQVMPTQHLQKPFTYRIFQCWIILSLHHLVYIFVYTSLKFKKCWPKFFFF